MSRISVDVSIWDFPKKVQKEFADEVIESMTILLVGKKIWVSPCDFTKKMVVADIVELARLEAESELCFDGELFESSRSHLMRIRKAFLEAAEVIKTIIDKAKIIEG